MPKQLKIMIVAVVGVLGLGALLFFNQPTEKAQTDTTSNSTDVLQADKFQHDFGTISMKNGKVTTVFTVKNPTAETLRLSKLYTTCMCTEAKLKINGQTEGPYGMPGHGAGASFDQKLDANQEAQIEVVYDPNAHGPAGVGVIERSVILESNTGPVVTLNIKANVTP